MKHADSICTLDDLRMRCYCDENGCWLWRGKADKHGNGPRVWLANDGVVTTLGRAAWRLAKQAPIKPGTTVWRTCRADMCGNPAHLLAGTKKQWGAWMRKSGHLRGRVDRMIINRRNKMLSGQTRMTMELAQWVRDSGQTGIEVAHALGESPSVVSTIRTGKTFVPARVPSSVWAWASV